MATLLFCVDAVYTFVEARKRAVRNVQAVQESGYDRFQHEGKVMTKAEAIEMLRAEPREKALPHFILALLLALCIPLAFRKPLISVIAALAVAAGGTLMAFLARPPPTFERFMFYTFVLFVLLLGLKASWAYHKWMKESPEPAG